MPHDDKPLTPAQARQKLREKRLQGLGIHARSPEPVTGPELRIKDGELESPIPAL